MQSRFLALLSLKVAESLNGVVEHGLYYSSMPMEHLAIGEYGEQFANILLTTSVKRNLLIFSLKHVKQVEI